MVTNDSLIADLKFGSKGIPGEIAAFHPKGADKAVIAVTLDKLPFGDLVPGSAGSTLDGVSIDELTLVVVPGPAVMLYFLVRRAGKRIARAATLILFVFSYGSVTALHALWGEMTRETWLLAAALLPFVIAGAVVGHAASGRLGEERFRAAILVILLVSGAYSLWTAL